MRRPFLPTHAAEPETAGNSRNRIPQELSELGWFHEGFGSLLTELTDPELTGPARDP